MFSILKDPKYRIFTVALAVLILVIGTSQLIGWHYRNINLILTFKNGRTMPINTAIGFLFLGFSFLSNEIKNYKLSQGISIILFLFSLLISSQYVFNLNFGIEHLISEQGIPLTAQNDGRVTPLACLLFLFSSSSLIVLNYYQLKNEMFSFQMDCGVIILCVSFIYFIGFVFELNVHFGLSDFALTAPMTALTFILFGKGTGVGLSISKKIIEDNEGKFYYDAKSSNTKFVIGLKKI